jgi:hypothetical protein
MLRRVRGEHRSCAVAIRAGMAGKNKPRMPVGFASTFKCGAPHSFIYSTWPPMLVMLT